MERELWTRDIVDMTKTPVEILLQNYAQEFLIC